jgi:hypothetical protein
MIQTLYEELSCIYIRINKLVWGLEWLSCIYISKILSFFAKRGLFIVIN